jgi:hypothetical protein
MYFEPETPADLAQLLALSDQPLGFKIYNQLSHIPFLILFSYACAYRRPLMGILTVAACLTSEGYHTCADFGYCAGLTFDVWRQLDHFTAPLLLVAGLSLFFEKGEDDINQRVVLSPEEADEIAALESSNVGVLDRDAGDVGAALNPPLFMNEFSHFWIAFAVICVALSVIIYGPSSSSPSIAGIVSSMISLGIYVSVFHIEPKSHVWDAYYNIAPRKMHYPYLAVGLALMFLALLFFWMPGASANTFMHSTWHIFAAVGLLFVLFAKERRPIGAIYEIDFEREWDADGRIITTA